MWETMIRNNDRWTNIMNESTAEELPTGGKMSPTGDLRGIILRVHFWPFQGRLLFFGRFQYLLRSPEHSYTFCPRLWQTSTDISQTNTETNRKTTGRHEHKDISNDPLNITVKHFVPRISVRCLCDRPDLPGVGDCSTHMYSRNKLWYTTKALNGLKYRWL